MKPKERFLTALHCQQPDRVPIWDFINNPALYKDVINKEIIFINGRDAVSLYREIGLDGAFIPTGGYNSLIDSHWDWSNDHLFRDEWGTLYSFEQSSWPCAFPIEFPVHTAEDWEKLKKPNPFEEWRFESARAAVKENQKKPNEEIAIVGGIRGPFSTASMILGMTQMSYLVYDNPSLLLEILNETSIFWTAIGTELIKTGIDAIVIVDDMGANNSTLISPKHLRKMVLPLLRNEVQALIKSGIPVFLHSCGNITSILSDVVEMGVYGLNNIQQSAGMNINEIKKVYGKQLCLIGNVNSSDVMAFGNPENVEKAVQECIEVASPGGGHILATDHSFHKGIPIENVYAFIEAGRKYGIY